VILFQVERIRVLDPYWRNMAKLARAFNDLSRRPEQFLRWQRAIVTGIARFGF